MMKLVKHLLIAIAIFLGSSLAGNAQDCSNFCVWPGDANNNGVANHFDVLQLGVAYGSTGPARNPAFVVDWSAKEAENWTNNFQTNGANYKHADSNGDGFIDEFDIFPMGDNFDDTNSLFTNTAEGNDIPGTDLTVTFNQSTYSSGQTVSVNISLGTPENPVSNLTGLAFSLKLDTQYIQQVIEPVTWDFGLIGPEQDLLLFDKWEPGISDAIHFSFARTNGIPINGFGTILTVEFVIIDDLTQHFNSSEPFPLDIINVLGIDNNETDLLITNQGDEATLLATTSTQELESGSFTITPNPFEDIIRIKNNADLNIKSIEIYDALGRQILQTNTPETDINTSTLACGIYILKILTDEGYLSQKMIKPK